MVSLSKSKLKKESLNGGAREVQQVRFVVLPSERFLPQHSYHFPGSHNMSKDTERCLNERALSFGSYLEEVELDRQIAVVQDQRCPMSLRRLGTY